MLADLVLPVVRHHLAVLLVIIPGGEIEMIEMQVDAVLFRGGLQHPQPLRRHFLPNTVAGNDRDPILLFFVAHRDIPLVLPRRECRPFDRIAMDQSLSRRNAAVQC
jgi:hypothetical protein